MKLSGIVAACAIAAAAGSAQAQSVELMDIPIVGAASIFVSDVNADGSKVAGSYTDANSDRFGFIYDLGTNVVTELGGVDDTLVLLSDDGTVAAGMLMDPLSLGEAAARWTAATNTWEILPNLGIPCSGTTFSLYDLSADGNHVVGLGWLGCGAGNAVALHWELGAGLETLLGVRAAAISNDGSKITGFDHHPTSGFRIWANWDNHAISYPTPENTGEGQVITPDGAYMAGMQGSDMVRYTETGGFEILGLGIGVFDISADGEMILALAGSGGPFGTRFPAMWTPGTGLVPLADYVGPALAGWGFGFLPQGIMSADGNTIVIPGGNDPTGTRGPVLIKLDGSSRPCACDFDVSTAAGVCDIFDFLAFQNQFVGSDPCACDIDTTTGAGVCDIFDFLAFQDEFVGGCP